MENENHKSSESIGTRGRTFVGTVTSTKMSKTITIEWERKIKIPKYERYEKRRTRIHAHLPEGIEVAVGDVVEVAETRPLSKTKNFVFVRKITAEKKEE